MNIRMKTNTVTNLLTVHKANHVEEYTKQIQGWKKSMEEYGIKLAEWRDNTPEDIFEASKYNSKKPVEPIKPQSFVDTYEKLIDIIYYHEETIIQLDEHDFNQIVKDEFGWKCGFMANSATYIN